MTKLLLPAALFALTASPAVAAPTCIWNAPTGKVTAGGNLHVGVYNYLTASRTAALQNALTFGASPGFEVMGLQGVGGLELGVDTMGSSEIFNGKLQLMGEGTLLPAVSVGGMGLFSTNEAGFATQNFLYGALSKEFKLGETSLGTWTLGGYSTQKTGGEAGFLGGVALPLVGPLSLSAEYVSGQTLFSGTTGYMTYTVAPNTYVSLGHFVHPTDSKANMTFAAVDLDVATGLFAR